MSANSVSSAVDSIKPNATRARAGAKAPASTPRGRRAVAAERGSAAAPAAEKPTVAATAPAKTPKTAPEAAGAASEGGKAKRKYTRKASSTPRAPRSGFDTGAVRKELNAQRSSAKKVLKDQAKAYKEEGKALSAEMKSLSKRMEQLEKTNDRVTKGAEAALAQADKLLEALA